MEDVNEGKQNVDEKESTSHPETVPWSQYVGLKEKFNKTEANYKGQVQTLEEQLKNAPNAEEFSKTKEELDKVKTEHQGVTTELKTIKDGKVSEMKEALKNKGVSDEELTDLSEEQLVALIKVIGGYKPKPDMGGGGGSGDLSGSPMQLAVKAYTKN